MRRYYTYITKENFLTAFYNVFKVIITSDNIKSGFTVIGFVLFDFNTVFFTFEIPLVIFILIIFPFIFAGFNFSFFTKTLINIYKVTK